MRYVYYLKIVFAFDSPILGNSYKLYETSIDGFVLLKVVNWLDPVHYFALFQILVTAF